MHRIEALHGGLDRPGKQRVTVCLGLGRVAGMKPLGFLTAMQDADGSWEQAIQASDQIRAGNGGFSEKAGDHCLGMHTCVCSAGAVQRYRIIANDLQAPLHFPLDGDTVFLSLPTTIIGAIVGDGESYVAHGRL